jgi:hypothetical protein
LGWAKSNIPGYKAISNVVIDPIGKSLASLDKAILAPVYKPIDNFVKSTIPGGWVSIGVMALDRKSTRLNSSHSLL